MTTQTPLTCCPRCGNPDCRDPDSKACSDNCIMRLNQELAAIRHDIARHVEICAAQAGEIERLRARSPELAFQILDQIRGAAREKTK